MAFQIGDYLELHPSPAETRFTQKFARLNATFIHEIIPGERRLFAKMTLISQQNDMRDWVLDIPLLRNTTEELIVGLPAILGKRHYIIQLSKEMDPATTKKGKLTLGSDGPLLYCNWDIQFL